MPTVNCDDNEERASDGMQGGRSDWYWTYITSALLFQPVLDRQARHLAAAGPGRCRRRTVFASLPPSWRPRLVVLGCTELRRGRVVMRQFRGRL